MVYDTKTVALEYCSKGSHRAFSNLASLYEQTLRLFPSWKSFEHPHQQEHDAGFDAYMTGVSFYGLCQTINNRLENASITVDAGSAPWNLDDDSELSRIYYGRNKIYFHLSPYTIDLECRGHDPLRRGMSFRSTFRVAGETTVSVNTGDIVRCLSGLLDSRGRRVNFEIIWVNDKTFLVGAMANDHFEESNLEEHGELLLVALRDRFPRQTIEYLETQEDSNQDLGILNLWGWLGSATRSNRPKKRRRVE